MDPKSAPRPGYDPEQRAADAALLEAVKRGDADSFDRFVARFGPMILAFGLRMCGHRQDAEDVFQETLVKVFTQLRSLEEAGALKTWLWRVVANECLMSRRGPRDPARAVGIEDLRGPDPDAPAVEFPDTSSPSPEQSLLALEDRERVERGLGNLPPDYRIIILLRDFEGLSTEEVAGVLNITEANAKVRLHRARAALRRVLEAELARGGEVGR